jgi:hypothetical protein
MIDNIKKYWFLYVPVSALIIWGVSINSRIFNSPEQKVEVISAIKSMPSAADRAVEAANDAHAMEIRQMRYNDNKRNDSIDKIYDRKKDSITLDYIKRQTVQIEQIKAKLNN